MWNVPFKVIHQTPRRIRSYSYFINLDCLQHLVNVFSVVINSPIILQSGIWIVGESIFRHVNFWATISVFQPIEQFSETPWYDFKPWCGWLWPTWIMGPVSILIIIPSCAGFDQGLHQLGRVMIQSQKVPRTYAHKNNRELGMTLSFLRYHL